MSIVNDHVDDQRQPENGKIPIHFQYNVFLAPISDEKGSCVDDIDFEFDTFKRFDFNFPLSLFLKSLLTIIFITRGSIATFWILQPTAPFYISFFCGSVAVVTGYTSIFSHLAIRSYLYGLRPLQKFHDWAVNLTASRHGHIAENADILCFTASFALLMFSRSLAGQCPEGVSMWDKQTCNPSADDRAVPPDLYGVTMFAPLIPQLVLGREAVGDRALVGHLRGIFQRVPCGGERTDG